MSLLDDPAGWAEGAVGSRAKLLLFIGGHVLIGLAGIIGIQGTGLDSTFTFGIALFGIAFPCMYLYAMRGLLTEYKKLRNPPLEKP